MGENSDLPYSLGILSVTKCSILYTLQYSNYIDVDAYILLNNTGALVGIHTRHFNMKLAILYCVSHSLCDIGISSI